MLEASTPMKLWGSTTAEELCDALLRAYGKVRPTKSDRMAYHTVLGVQSRSVMESAMLILHSGRPYGTDSSRQRQDHARRPSCYTAIEGFDPRARQPLRS